MYTHLRTYDSYEDSYDRITVDSARQDMATFTTLYEDFFKIMPDEPRKSIRATIHLNIIYMATVGYALIERYDNRNDAIRDMMARDRAKDEQVANARLTSEPLCQHCSKTGLRITNKLLTSRSGSYKSQEVLFMLKCSHCDTNSAYWEDGTPHERLTIYCPKCNSTMNEKTATTVKAVTTTYTCSSCGHSYKDKYDLTRKEEAVDPNFEVDRVRFCLQDEAVRDELRRAKQRFEEMARIGKEYMDKEDNKPVYDSIDKLVKLKIAEIVPLLQPVLEKAGYTELGLDKPEMGKDVLIGFNCLDTKSNRNDHDSTKTLKNLIKKQLETTNWRLTGDGVRYRLGYLNGRLRAYEREEDLKQLVMKSRKSKPKQEAGEPDEKNDYTQKRRR